MIFKGVKIFQSVSFKVDIYDLMRLTMYKKVWDLTWSKRVPVGDGKQGRRGVWRHASYLKSRDSFWDNGLFVTALPDGDKKGNYNSGVVISRDRDVKYRVQSIPLSCFTSTTG